MSAFKTIGRWLWRWWTGNDSGRIEKVRALWDRKRYSLLNLVKSPPDVLEKTAELAKKQFAMAEGNPTGAFANILTSKQGSTKSWFADTLQSPEAQAVAVCIAIGIPIQGLGPLDVGKFVYQSICNGECVWTMVKTSEKSEPCFVVTKFIRDGFGYVTEVPRPFSRTNP